MNLDRISWDDLKIALALAHNKTMAAAAQTLQVHQSTVSRRIHTLEEHLGVKLFIASESGIVMTEAGRALARRAEKIAVLTAGLESDIDTARQDDRQSVRISAVSTFITGFLHDHTQEFLRANPQIRLDFVGEERNAVLERREADIAVRHARPVGGQAITRKLTDLGTAIYAARRLTDGNGNLTDDAPWIGFSRPLDYMPEQQWIDANIPAQNVVMSFAAASTYANAVTRGVGAGLLSCMIGDRHPELVRVHPGEPIMWREGWLMVLDDTRRRPAVRSVITWLTDICKANEKLFRGELRHTKTTKEPAS